MKMNFKLFLTLAMALCLAVVSFAAPNVVLDKNGDDGVLFGDDFAELFGDDTLDAAPEKKVTAEDLMVVSVRLHNALNGGSLSATYNQDAYYAYGVNNGIFADGAFELNSNATRAQVIMALYNAVNGKVDFTAINNVLDILDGDMSHDYYEKARTFMNAGIIYGYDEYGTFMPANFVKRYELGLMVDRLLNPTERVTKEYRVYTTAEHIYLIDDFLLDHGARGWLTGGSGWRIDYTGSTEVGTINNYANYLRDYAVDDNMSTSRQIHVQDSGELVFEAVYEFDSGNTLWISFYDVDGNEIASTGWHNGIACVGAESYSSVTVANKKEKDISPDVDQFNYYMAGKLRTRVVLDLDKGIYNVWMGTDKLGENHLLGGKNIAKVKFHTGIEEVSCVDLDNAHLWKNYKVNDVFRLENQKEAPVGYEVTGNVTVERLLANASNTGEVNSMKMVVSSGNTNAKRKFDKATGNVVAEAYVLFDTDVSEANYGGKALTNSAYFTVKSADTAAITVKNTGNKWYANGRELDLTTAGNEFTSNVWQFIRIEADTKTQKALIKINGKVAAENVPFLVKVDGFDSLEVGVDATEADTIWFDDIEVYETFVDYYNTDDNPNNDYVPVPEPLDTGDYILNMSVCNLWRNGSHYGWDWIRPFAELEPAIGYFDEGNPEEMDWEIKYLVEHGIKNYMTCWYPTSQGTPLKKPRMVDAIHDGYFNAKYSNMMTFSLMYENSGGYQDKHREDFKNVIFPLWMDWYFSDPRYCRIEEGGKEYLFLTIYQHLMFLDMCSTDNLLSYDSEHNSYSRNYSADSTQMTNAYAAAKNMIQWMEDEIIAAGYADGLIVCFGGSTNTNQAYKEMAQMGGDGAILYAWGKTAWDVETQKTLATDHMASAKAQGIDMLTLATPGFNDIGWTSLRPGYMSTNNFKTMVQWHKTRMDNNTVGYSQNWKKKFITFDTWNEFGEGHYLFPTMDKVLDENGNIVKNNVITGDPVYSQLGYGGFGYLDAIADVFGGVTLGSADAEANNTYPTAIQKARVGTIYVDDIDHYIRRDVLESVETPDNYVSLGGRDYTKENSTADTQLEKSPSNWKNLKTGISAMWSSEYFKYDSSKKCYYGTSSSSCDSSKPARIDLDGDSQFKNINMDEVEYIRLKLGTSTGGSYGKIYFKNTTDTSQYDGYSEERIFRFNTYVDGSDSCNYLINVKEHKKWTGTLAGIMLECTNEPNETVYIYDLEFIKADSSTAKPTFYVDNVKYDCRDYGEIRGDFASGNWGKEIWMCPTEEGGLYKLLHIVYDWNRDTKVLKLDTPNGTTFEFDYNTKQYKKNGTVVGTDSNVVLYDGAPVVPMLYILDNAGYYYSYDHTGKRVDVTLANSFEKDFQIENGDAEGANTTEFYSGASAYAVSVVTDPKDSTNKVWNVPSAASKVWTYVRTDFKWVAGKTYTIDFDARRTGTLGDGSTHPEASSKLVFNARYPDTAGTNGVEHNPEATKVVITNDWQHYTITYTVAETLDTASSTAHQLSFYVDPYNDLGVPYQLDNVVIRTKPLPFKFTNALDTNGVNGFKTANSKNSVSQDSSTGAITTTCGDTSGRTWNYLQQETTFEKGVTYYYRVKAKLGNNAAGQATSGMITLNARYADTSRLSATGEWFAHSQNLMDKLGKTLTFKSGEDWQQCYGQFTISQGYVPIADFVTPSGLSKAVEQISFFSNPDSSYGISFSIDDFEVTTDPDVYASWMN